jgi:pimeloyl-ACP methyl ester carboxylesterase
MARGQPGGHGGCLLLVVDRRPRHRAALGEDVVTFVGWSYGAWLGAHYAYLFPARVRALVLDGPPDLQAMRGSVVEPQIAGFEAAFRSCADRCSQRESCVPFGDPRALFDRVVRTARSTPIPSGRPVGDPPANAETVLRAVLGFLASPEAWPFLALRDTVTASPVLVIATEADPSTPHSGGVAIARAIGPSANLLTISGGGHTAFARSPCVAEHVTLYLVELRVPGGQAC